MPKEIINIIDLLSDGKIWIYFVIMIIVFYGIIALLTWDWKKPMLFLGIPSVIIGLIMILLKTVIITILASEFSLVEVVGSSVSQPLLTYGIICLLMGVAMIGGYIIINKVLGKKNKEVAN